jgi:AcrR family transcriptional regulator
MSGRRASRTQLRASSLESQESLRQNIIHAARDLFRHHGYEAVSMRRIAARIGYTVSAIYHYFPSKQSVLIHVWDEDLRYFASYVKGAVDQAETPVGKVQMIFMSYIRYWESNPDKFRLLFSPSSGVDRETRGREHEPVYATWLKSYSESREIVAKALKLSPIAPTDPDMALQCLMSGAHGVVALKLSPSHLPWFSMEEMGRLLIDSVLEGWGLLPRPKTLPGQRAD